VRGHENLSSFPRKRESILLFFDRGGVTKIKVDARLTRAILALALRASYAVRARSGARSRGHDG
jgi:hypothetical protein